MRTLLSSLFEQQELYGGKTVTVSGWARTIRDSKAFGFIELNDGTCFKSVQVVFARDEVENYDDIARQNVGCALTVTGIVILTPENKQPFEIKAKIIEVEGKSTPEFPMQKKRHSLEFLREVAHLRPRTNLFNAVMRVRSKAAYAVHSFFNERNFIYVHTPIVTASDCEGAGEMFQITTFDLNNVPKNPEGEVDYTKDFFGKKAGLTVSGQLEVETYAMAFSNVYTFGPTFRAEHSNTQRHAAEFWQIEPEIAFADLADDMDLAEDMIKYVVKYVLLNCKQEIEFFDEFVDKGLKERLSNLVKSNFVRISYTEAVKLLEPHNDEFEFKVKWGEELATEHEKYLTEKIYKSPVFVMDYPKDFKAFYMRLNDDKKTVAAADMLVPGIGELIGASQREERYEVLEQRMRELNMNVDEYWWYLDLRRYGGNKHAGFGLGFERLVMYLTGINNIRDSIPFPRTVYNAEF
ncbi:MAG TPA: asparagine--tRNA ligase [Clostridia bacterium]|nr:asparagine--tRNA ligase [Clostridia bacterium]